MELYYGSPRSVDFGTILHQFPNRAFRKLTRPPVPLLDYWGRAPAEAFGRGCKALQLNPPSDGKVCFRRPVPAVWPAKPSVTDVMVTAPTFVLGVTGTATAPPGRTVGAWHQ